MSRVTVKIYGQEYTITGETGEEEIKAIAAYVDQKMHEVAQVVADKSAGSLAILSSINITEEFFETRQEGEKLKVEYDKLMADARHYKHMWEQSKKTTQNSSDSLGELQQRLRDDQTKIKELQDKCGEYESNFFELQMENIKLKNELDKLRNRL
ncbi:MAG: cell division protein ZapA [Eubacterium sp.]|nr:cell division protein ZapA [Eubacterium sp.]